MLSLGQGPSLMSKQGPLGDIDSDYFDEDANGSKPVTKRPSPKDRHQVTKNLSSLLGKRLFSDRQTADLDDKEMAQSMPAPRRPRTNSLPSLL